MEISEEKLACGIFNLKFLKYKERDLIIERLEFWKSLINDSNFLIEKCFEYRDNRLRFLYKERYDYRKNLIDADFVWGIDNCMFPKHSLIQH